MIKNLFRKTASFSKGFTLIELLIVISIIGILAAGILVAVDPVDKINQGNDAKVQNDISAAGRATEAYATLHNGFYPATIAELVAAGELKREPSAPSGYTAYSAVAKPASCVSGTECTSIIIEGQLKSKRYTSVFKKKPIWRYNSSSGASCAMASGSSASTACP